MLARTAALTALSLSFVFAQQPQQLSCSTRQYLPPNVRVEGLTELLGDVVAVCTGGTPTASGAAIPSIDITVSVPLPVTNNKASGTNYIDALLLVDEPHSVANPSVPLLPCVNCSILGNGTGRGNYNGSTGHANVFQGEIGANNTITFRVPFDPPGTGAERTIRVANIRVNATGMAGKNPNLVTVTLAVPGATMTGGGTQIVGLAHRALRIATVANNRMGFVTLEPTVLTACPPGGTVTLTDPNSGLLQPDFLLRLEEGVRDGLRARNILQEQSSGPSGGFFRGVVANANQNVVGYRYRTESGLYSGAGASPANPVPQLPFSAQPFDATRGLDKAGLATQGTRFHLRFSNAEGLTISVPTTLVAEPTINFAGSMSRVGDHAGGTRAILISGDTTGNFTPVAGNAKGFAALTTNAGTATAIYEVVSADAESVERIEVPVFVAQAPRAFAARDNVQVAVGLGPVSDATGSDSTAPMPRFSSIADTVDAFTFSNVSFCDKLDLTGRVAFALDGTSRTAGTLSISPIVSGDRNFDSRITAQVTLPAGFTATAIGGSLWACTLSTLTCSIRGDLHPPSLLTVAVNVPSNVSGTFSFVTTFSATGDQIPNNNTIVTPIKLAQRINPPPFSAIGSIQPVYERAVVGADGIYAETDSLEVIPGSTFTLSTLPIQYLEDGSRLDFDSWYQNGGTSSSISTTVAYYPKFRRSTNSDTTMVCVANSGVPPLISATGKTESLGDLVLYCQGGTPTAAGAPVPKVDIRLSVGSVLTSRLTSATGGYSEVLLVIDEPHSTTAPNRKLLPCSGTNCSPTGAGANTYNGTEGRPNVFQGVFDGKDSVVFQQVPLDPPGADSSRILRFTNIRADSHFVPIQYGLTPASLSYQVTLAPTSAARIINAQQIGGFIQWPVRTVVDVSAGAMQQCVAANSLVATETQVSVRVVETFPSSFQPRSWTVRRAGGTSYPADGKQDVPGVVNNTRTMFYAGPGSEFDLAWTGWGSAQLTPSPDFPATRGLNIAGKADWGTRVYVMYSGVPQGVKIYTPVEIALGNTLSGSGAARLTVADTNGSGAFSKPTGNGAGLYPVTITNGQGVAVYEILSANEYAIEELRIPAAISYEAGAAGLGTITVTAGLAPVVNAPFDATDLTQSIPRFAVSPIDGKFLASIVTCAVPDIQVTMLRSGAPSTTNSTTYTITVSNVGQAAAKGTQTLSIGGSPAAATSVTGSGWTCSISSSSCTRQDDLAPGASYPPIQATFGPVAAGGVAGVNVQALTRDGEIQLANNSVSDYAPVLAGGQKFLTLQQPCRVYDSRLPLAGGPVAKNGTRTISMQGLCGVSSLIGENSPSAYSLNVTVVPKTTLGYLTIWPAGQTQPVVSTLNSLDGRVKANAAIVPAGANGAINVFVTDETDVIVDLNGYFSNSSLFSFFPVTPCRMVDTRNAAGATGGPVLTSQVTRSFPLFSSNCLPAGATAPAYSINATVVPVNNAPMGFLTLWDSSQSRPTVSTLNAVTGAITANAAIVATSASVSAYATGNTHLLLDLNGYFSSVPSGLKFYPVTPCRISDTRNATGPFGGPALTANAERSYDVPASSCGIPANAQAYSINATVVPSGPFGFLTMWPTGSARPVVSTLNALDGAITSNAALVPAGTGGKISVFGTDVVHLILDVNGYFAP